jgi:hypothetical protein
MHALKELSFGDYEVGQKAGQKTPLLSETPFWLYSAFSAGVS